jgi:hypothetical protein
LLLVAGVHNGTMDGLNLMYRMGLWMVQKGAQSTKWVVVGRRCTEWDYGWLEKVPCVPNGIVDGSERCSEYSMTDAF